MMNSDSLFSQPLELSPERRAILARKLENLLADFAHLQELERPELEPVSTEWLVRNYARDR
jgi:hypothetical protein